ncbi:hypothetical protein CPC735_061970 [Coccidioides posadasii C735 delta SOWgp]|uniref:Uncharacterized protein n=1 Tax=Coccidioides posadasii (strain C735) TaxID=222929 RepID=C5P3Q6_COCP7|nr:hypothetical protein CPC735_061970 [Coccidioides posadasii C735 delta SOWgp]EER28324.1 hypothetical protein CPC735_061970 [Coccidioides posadasii C735 delta SOWgp]|eukprot:XP_003070469.1 hypothetical protein CPC735_061970 [Coccidioides posadasii C735 delta SOWgp]
MSEFRTPSETRRPRRHRVCYIPEQIDKTALTSPPTTRNNPVALMCRDVRTLTGVLPLLPNLFRPFSTGRNTDELSLKGRNSINLVVLVVVTVLESLAFTLMSLSYWVLPGLLSIPVAGLLLGLVWLLCAPLRGPDIVYSSLEGDNIINAARRKKERWVFVNGILQSHYGLKQNCDRLAAIFGRPIIGIHNATYGLVGDLLECIIQRSFSFNTYSIRFTYDQVKAFLVDPTVHKVVLIGHSQGGIILSMVLDLLFTDVPAENMAKLEVYTFGSAASHFNNPLRAINPCSGTARTGVIPYIEHYVNSEDLVPRWGVLYNVRTILENRFAGKIFIRMGATGHMLNQHYLDFMFPPLEAQHNNEELGFLDQVVEVDEATPDARDQFAHRVLNVPARACFAENGRCMSINEDMVSTVGTTFKTVREISRLWRYMEGNDPDDLGGRPCVN